LQDVASAFGPDEWLGLSVVMSDVLIDGANQFWHAGEYATPQALGVDVAEESLDHVEPGRRGWREVHIESPRLSWRPVGLS
jgi:hypothetical protein